MAERVENVLGFIFKPTLVCAFVIAFCFLFLSADLAQATTLTIGPAGGTFSVGSTFDVSIFVNTQGKTINALEINLQFPPDKLQVASSLAGQSIISVWTSQPRFNNQNGTILIAGGIPGGINMSNGLITTITFRVRSVGGANIKFSDETKVLLNDGFGTEDLSQTNNGVYQLVLPPPAGPTVSSVSHPDQTAWYSSQDVIFSWITDESVGGYSHLLSDQPVDAPDNISEGTKNSVSFQNVTDGTKYFHIKSLQEGVWGGTTHFAVNIDATPPAEFPIEISPRARTTTRTPVVSFVTTDAASSVDHYEVKIIPLSYGNVTIVQGANSDQNFFVEATSPYVPGELRLGTYDVIVRAYDKAGNFREVTHKLAVVNPIFRVVGSRGLELRGTFTIPWPWFWLMVMFILILLGYTGYRLKLWHHDVHFRHEHKVLPTHTKSQIAELKRYRARYGKLVVFLVMMGSGLFFSRSSLALDAPTQLQPPIVTTISRNISNEEIFYVGGMTNVPASEIIIYVQNKEYGAVFSETVKSDEKGSWFYRHHTFLNSGTYDLWVQARLGELVSPPSPQSQMQVSRTALQMGATRISLEFLYLVLLILMFLVFLGTLIYTIYHGLSGRKKHILLLKEVKEAEESIRRGFAVLKRDIEQELTLVRKTSTDTNLSAEERQKEKQLLKDLEEIRSRIGKEVWEIESAVES